MTRRVGSWAKTTEAIKKIRRLICLLSRDIFHEKENRAQAEKFLAEKFLRTFKVSDYKIQRSSNSGRGAIVQWKAKKKGHTASQLSQLSAG
jgi:hypothetical protein